MIQSEIKMKKILFIVIFMAFVCNNGYSQMRMPGQWSLMIEGNVNMNHGLSYAMRGTNDEFLADIANDYLNYRYPFADRNAFSSYIGAQLAYRFPESDWSVYSDVSMTLFYTWDYIGFLNHVDAGMPIFSFTPGVEYTVGDPLELWNFFARAGISSNLIFGWVDYVGNEVYVNPGIRFGLDLAAGGRLNIPHTPLALETSINYSNINIIGKNFVMPDVQPNDEIIERHLNDAKNPNDPRDDDKTIDYLGFRIGLRLWF